MGTFFNSRDVIFDESFSNHPFPNTNSDDKDDDNLPHATHTPCPVAPAPVTNAPIPPAPARHSSRNQNPTEHRCAYCEQLANDAARLCRQYDLRQASILGIPPADDSDMPVPPVPILPHPALLPAPIHPLADVAEHNNDTVIHPDLDTVGFLQSLANLIITELACILIHSNSR
jgi:hypothetical protein